MACSISSIDSVWLNWVLGSIFQGLSDGSRTKHPRSKRCSDISATDISAQDVSAWTFRPRKMPKVDVSAITINFEFGMCAYINV